MGPIAGEAGSTAVGVRRPSRAARRRERVDRERRPAGGPSAANAFLTAFFEHPYHPKIHLDQHHLGPIQPSDLRPILPSSTQFLPESAVEDTNVDNADREVRLASSRVDLEP
jgi:hypothetical protein